MGASRLPGGVVLRDDLERQTVGSGPVHRDRGPELPCERCAHAPVCRIRPRLAEEHFEELRSPDPAVRLVIRIECEHYLAGAVVEEPAAPPPEPVRIDAAKARLASQHRGGEANRRRQEPAKAERKRRVLEALERHGGDRAAAAAELGMRPNALAMVLKFAVQPPSAPPEASA